MKRLPFGMFVLLTALFFIMGHNLLFVLKISPTVNEMVAEVSEDPTDKRGVRCWYSPCWQRPSCSKKGERIAYCRTNRFPGTEVNQMSNDSVICSRSFLHNAKVRWITYFLLAAVFFIAQHDLLFSLRGDFFGSSEALARGIVEGNFRSRIVFSLLGLFGAVNLMRRGQNCLGINGVLMAYSV